MELAMNTPVVEWHKFIPFTNAHVIFMNDPAFEWQPRPHHCRLVHMVIDWLRDTGKMIYRELHISDFVETMDGEIFAIVDTFRESWGETIAQVLNEKAEKYHNFIEGLDDKIHNSIDDICVDGQPANFY